MRGSLFRTLLWGVLVLAGIELALLELAVSQDLRWSVAGITAAVAVLGTAAAFFFSRDLTARLRRLKAWIEAMVSGGAKMARPAGVDELGTLAESVARAAGQVNDLLEKMRLE